MGRGAIVARCVLLALGACDHGDRDVWVQALSKGDLFVAGIVLLESCAALSYAMDRQWMQAGIWLGVSASNTFYLLTTRS